MKIGKTVIPPPADELVVIPRGDSFLPFTCSPVLDYSEFDELCPEPTPPTVHTVGEAPKKDYLDKKYLQKLEERGEKRMAWMCIRSLQKTEGLEWETVKNTEPDTWTGWRAELEGSNLTQLEQQRILAAILDVNGLNESRMDEARDSFLAQQSPKQNE